MLSNCIRFATAFFTCLALSVTATAQPGATTLTPALLDTLDGAVTQLRIPTTNTNFRIGQTAIDRRNFRYGTGAEEIQVRGPAGEAAEVAYSVGQAPVIKELRISADLISSRTGVRLAARVVLPRANNPSTGQPFELLVRGGMIGSGRRWEQLILDDLPQRLANHARVARAKHRQVLDERGAYVSQIVFLTPGGAGVTELLVDRIQVFGVVNASSRTPTAPRTPIFSAPQAERPSLASANSPPLAAKKRSVRLPRIIQWQGEPFESLQKLGFNTIGLQRLPTDEELQQVERLGLALVTPPPPPEALTAKAITAKHNSILAWDLGELLSADDLNSIEQWERLVARYDPVSARPTVLAPQLNALESSRISDVILVGRPVIGTELTIREHSAWLSQRQHLARPGTPSWTKIETQPSHRHRLQMAALSSAGTANSQVSYAQHIASISAALGIKTRGFYFESQSPLDADDVATQRRALALELTNLRVQLTEPWLLAGKEVSSARSTQEDLSALVMQAERSHLLVPVWWSQDMQSEVHPRRPGPVSFVVPGVAESSEAFLVTLGGVQRVRHKRVTGGIRITLEQLPYDGFLLLSDDRQAIAQVTQYVRRIAARATKLRRDLAGLKLQAALSMTARMGSAQPEMSLTRELLQQAMAQLAKCDQHLQSKSFALAYLDSDAADQSIDQAQNALLAKAGGTQVMPSTFGSHVSIPLHDRLHLQRTLARAPLSTNLLSGGGFENLAALLDNGWRHKQLSLDGITSSVRLSPESPHSGSYCLELEARTLDESAPMTIVPTAPVWISSNPVQVHKGDLLEITGVARVPQQLLGSVDGLQIIDSLGGTDMALRIQESTTWKPFKLIRAATSDTQVTITIALTGLGKAQIDDVAVRVVRNSR